MKNKNIEIIDHKSQLFEPLNISESLSEPHHCHQPRDWIPRNFLELYSTVTPKNSIGIVEISWPDQSWLIGWTYSILCELLRGKNEPMVVRFVLLGLWPASQRTLWERDSYHEEQWDTSRELYGMQQRAISSIKIQPSECHGCGRLFNRFRAGERFVPSDLCLWEFFTYESYSYILSHCSFVLIV